MLGFLGFVVLILLIFVGGGLFWMGGSRISKNHQFLGGWLLEFHRMHALDYFWPNNIIGYNLIFS